MDENTLGWHLSLWMIAIAVLSVSRSRRREHTVGFMLAYLLNLWLIHWPAMLLYLQPGYRYYDTHIVLLGFEQSVYAVCAFVAGSIILAPMILDTGLFPEPRPVLMPDHRLPKAYMVIGCASYALLNSTLSAIPSATSLISTGQQLIVVGLALLCWQAFRSRDYPMLTRYLAVTLCLPLVTIVTRGFIGYGAVATFSVLIFLSSLVRSKMSVMVGGLLLGYLGLSVYVTYMRDRGEIREVVWGGQSLTDRIGRVATTVQQFEWFDPGSREHQQRIDARLNQNHLVGAAVSRLSSIGGYANGATFWEATLALIPRALWPDKAIRAGSGSVVSDYTGIQFAAGTSVGIGHVLEFYINFGTLGVLIGFACMGVAVTIVDKMAASYLAMHDLRGFVVWYVPGMSLLQVGGSFIELTVSAVAGIVVAFMANKYLERLERIKGPAGERAPVYRFQHA